jgi:hypothetical protein
VITTPAIGGNQGYVLPNPQTGVPVERPADRPMHYDRNGNLVPY